MTVGGDSDLTDLGDVVIKPERANISEAYRT
jgi:hypothetical protein